jgi:hypothetical protein
LDNFLNRRLEKDKAKKLFKRKNPNVTIKICTTLFSTSIFASMNFPKPEFCNPDFSGIETIKIVKLKRATPNKSSNEMKEWIKTDFKIKPFSSLDSSLEILFMLSISLPLVGASQPLGWLLTN